MVLLLLTSDYRRRCLVAAAAILTASALVALTGCGGSSDSTPERSAAAAGYDTSCKEFKGTKEFTGTVVNVLHGPVTLSVPQGSYDCSDWSGVSTPGRAFNGVVLAAEGGSSDFRLEANRRSAFVSDGGPWTMEVATPIYGGAMKSTSSTRLNIDGEPISAVDEDAMRWTNWGSPPRKYIPGGETPIRNSEARDVNAACSRDSRATVLGVYENRLSWFFCTVDTGGAAKA